MTDTVTIVVLLLLVALRVLVICAAAWVFIPKRRACPHCAAATMGLVSPAWMLRLRIQRRWCTCGWHGWSKRFEWRPPEGGGAADPTPRPAPGHRANHPAPPPRPTPRVPGDHA